MSKNDVTGNEIATKAVNDLYRDGFDRIFGQKETGLEESSHRLLEVAEDANQQEHD